MKPTAMTSMANFELIINADSGYRSTTMGRCTAEQYGDAIAALHGQSTKPAPEPLTDQQADSIVDGLAHCLHQSSKREFLKTWIRDWTNK